MLCNKNILFLHNAANVTRTRRHSGNRPVTYFPVIQALPLASSGRRGIVSAPGSTSGQERRLVQSSIQRDKLPMKTPLRGCLRSLLLVATSLTSLFAQSTPAPTPPKEDKDLVVLSPFEVSSDNK